MDDQPWYQYVPHEVGVEIDMYARLYSAPTSLMDNTNLLAEGEFTFTSCNPDPPDPNACL